MNISLWFLLASTVSIAFIHALAPDHWLPFAAIARAQRWSKIKLLWVTFLSGLGYLDSSIIFSLIGIILRFSLHRES